jgi:hypothetical protein
MLHSAVYDFIKFRADGLGGEFAGHSVTDYQARACSPVTNEKCWSRVISGN